MISIGPSLRFKIWLQEFFWVEGQSVAWNVWLNEPGEFDTEECTGHSEKWLHSITVDHEYPDHDEGSGRFPTYLDGKPYKPFGGIEKKLKFLKKFCRTSV
mmetsp:Transcript_21920/g.28807  ORF Transcript_21920/g.28807 Transcript_21920/m.28807 type:complete len:100 (+) Transcript_21920:302-601(+)